jgi:hypothetical protein
MSATRMRGLSEEYGSWKTICMSRRALRMRSRENCRTFSPRNQHLARRRFYQPQDAAARRALATAGLADQAEHLALADR